MYRVTVERSRRIYLKRRPPHGGRISNDRWTAAVGDYRGKRRFGLMSKLFAGSMSYMSWELGREFDPGAELAKARDDGRFWFSHGRVTPVIWAEPGELERVLRGLELVGVPASRLAPGSPAQLDPVTPLPPEPDSSVEAEASRVLGLWQMLRVRR